MLRIGGSTQSPHHDKGFIPCKLHVDAHYRCMTDDNYGN